MNTKTDFNLMEIVERGRTGGNRQKKLRGQAEINSFDIQGYHTAKAQNLHNKIIVDQEDSDGHSTYRYSVPDRHHLVVPHTAHHKPSSCERIDSRNVLTVDGME